MKLAPLKLPSLDSLGVALTLALLGTLTVRFARGAARWVDLGALVVTALLVVGHRLLAAHARAQADRGRAASDQLVADVETIKETIGRLRVAAGFQ